MRVGYYKLHFVWVISAIRNTTTVAHAQIHKAGADDARDPGQTPTTIAAGTDTTTATAKNTAGGKNEDTDSTPALARGRDVMRRPGLKNATRRLDLP